MENMVGLLIGVCALAALVTLAPVAVNRILWRLENGLSLASAGLVLFAMLFVTAEVFSRNPVLFNSPIPGHLELSELLMPPLIYLAISYTQATGGHVRMTLFIDLLPPKGRAFIELVVRALSIGICAILCYFSAKHALRVWQFGDVTMSPPYFVVWPSAIMAPVGLFLLTLRMYLEVVHLVAPKLLPITEPGLASTSMAE